MSKKVFVIAGPTSSGKTSLALDLCKKLNGEIISADSRQIYKYMDIGTGKVPLNSPLTIEKHSDFWSLDGVNVWGYDLAEPGTYFSVYDFSLYALKKAGELLKMNKTVFITGGTGFYIDVVTGAKTVSGVKPNQKLRDNLEKLTTEELARRLTSLNIAAYEKIDKNNRSRLIRALEIAVSKDFSSSPLPYLKNVAYVYIGLKTDRQSLYKRADLWLEQIWHNGLLAEEVTSLIDKSYENTPQLNGLIYKTAKSFLKSEISENEAIKRCKYDLHAYIRRQETWFKANKNIKWFDISEPDYTDAVSEYIVSKQ